MALDLRAFCPTLSGTAIDGGHGGLAVFVREDLVVPHGEVVVGHEAGGRAALAVRVQVAVAVAVRVAVGRQQQVGAGAEDGAAAANEAARQ